MTTRILYLSLFIILFLSCSSEENSSKESAIPTNIIKEDLKLVPKLETFGISDINLLTIKAGGKLIEKGGSEIKEVGLVAGYTSGPTIENNLNKFILKINEKGEFYTTIESFPANTTFYIRSYGINTDGVGYGNEVTFTSPIENYVGIGVRTVLSTQEEVNAFGLNHYTTLNDLEIKGTVTDLSPLNSIIIIKNSLTINNTVNLKNLIGLDNLKATGTRFANGIIIANNTALESLKGLSNLEYSNGNFSIINNDNLTNLQGLNNYKYTNYGDLIIRECDRLLNLSGIENYNAVSGILFLGYNLKLNDISSLSNLNFIGKRIQIMNNSSLQNLNGLEKLTSTEGVEIQYNDSLTNINGLSNLVSVGGIYIGGNDKLNNLSAFHNITTVGNLSIENTSLTNLQGLNNLTRIEGTLNIKSNLNLSSFSGLENLNSIQNLYVHSNNSLINFQGLNNLKTITADSYSITIGYNSKLNSLSGLEKLSQVGGSIQIFSNSMLTNFCSLKPLFTNGTYNGFIYIPGTNINEIINKCN